MGLLTKTVFTRWNGSNIKWYINKGYIYNKGDNGKEFEVNIEDLSDGSNVFVEVYCDCKECKNTNPILIEWKNYLKQLNMGKYYCINCNKKLYYSEKIK